MSCILYTYVYRQLCDSVKQYAVQNKQNTICSLFTLYMCYKFVKLFTVAFSFRLGKLYWASNRGTKLKFKLNWMKTDAVYFLVLH